MPPNPSELALADTAATLDPEHPVNVSLRERAIGFAAKVREVNLKDKYAVVGSSAIMSFFRVPLGWFCIDDGRRALVFDEAQEIQVNLNLRRHTGTEGELLNLIAADARTEQADIDARKIQLGGYTMLALGNLRIGAEVLMQVYLVKRAPQADHMLVARITAAEPHMPRAMDLAEVIMTDLEFAGE